MVRGCISASGVGNLVEFDGNMNSDLQSNYFY